MVSKLGSSASRNGPEDGGRAIRGLLFSSLAQVRTSSLGTSEGGGRAGLVLMRHEVMQLNLSVSNVKNCHNDASLAIGGGNWKVEIVEHFAVGC